MATSLSPAIDAQISSTVALTYWRSISATVNGMLGGFPQISRIDLRGSINFFTKLRRQFPAQPSGKSLARGVDCGAGIGRVTAEVLSKICEVVDVVEPVEKFTKGIKEMKMAGEGKIGDIYISGLEDWVPKAQYDLIWNQWCLGYLTDKQLVIYMESCRNAVAEEGWIVVKENISTDVNGKDIFDALDSSVTRADRKFKKLFEEAGLELVRTEQQTGFPKGLFPVRFYALRPRKTWRNIRRISSSKLVFTEQGKCGVWCL